MIYMEQAYCEALKTAIEFEQNGVIFYRQLIDRVVNPFAKRVLIFLIGEEFEHIRKIESFNNSLLGQGEFDFETECSLDITDKIQMLVQDRKNEADKNITPNSSDSDIYEVAMLLEMKSHELYEQALSEATNEKVETFFRFMLAEEREHYDLLAASKRYLEDSSYYFEDFGGWIFG